MKEILARLVAGEDLAGETMERAVGIIMDGDASAAEIGAFLAALRMKGETATELVAAVRAMRARCVKVPFEGPLLDTCGTGGDGLGTFNISTATAFVAAAAGLKVAKHGNRAASGKVGAADVLEAAGARIDLGADEAARALEEVGIAFLFAPVFHPAVKHVAAARREVGFRTLFNLTGPLCNPAGASHQLIGLFAEEWLEPVAAALGELGSVAALVVHGSDGSDEITLAGPTEVVELCDGTTRRYRIAPEDFDISPCPMAELLGGDADRSVEILRSALGGQAGPASDIVALNAGAAFYVGAAAGDIGEGVAHARELMLSGEALAKLDAFVAFTRRGGE